MSVNNQASPCCCSSRHNCLLSTKFDKSNYDQWLYVGIAYVTYSRWIPVLTIRHSKNVGRVRTWTMVTCAVLVSCASSTVTRVTDYNPSQLLSCLLTTLCCRQELRFALFAICHIMLCHIILHYTILYYTKYMTYYIILFYIILYHIKYIKFYVTLYHIILYFI